MTALLPVVKAIRGMRPVSLFAMDDAKYFNLSDKPGNNRNGVVNGTSTPNAYYTKAGQPYVDGRSYWKAAHTSSGSVRCSSIVTTSQPLSFVCWVYLDSTSEFGIFMALVDAGSSKGVSYGVGDGTVANSGAYENAGNRVMSLAEGVAWVNDTSTNWGTGWMMTGMTLASNSLTIYKNGQSVKTGTLSPNFASVQTLSVGGYTAGANNRHFGNGQARVAAYWDRALTAQEMMRLHVLGNRRVRPRRSL